MSQKKIIVSNRLPVTANRDEESGALEFKPSAGGLATGLSSIFKEKGNLWIGWPGIPDFKEDEKPGVIKSLRGENMAPVFLNKKEVLLYYEGFSNRTLWPLFHYFTEFTQYTPEDWDMYVAVNQKFCDAILEYAGPDDIIWVHDYQLLLLPSMLREKLPNATIGFFQHIPFPSYEIFRLLPWRSEILEGMLGADLLGFHTYDDTRHFMSSVSRIAGYPNSMGTIKMANRIISVDAFPMGIDYDKFEKAARSKETYEKVDKYKSLFANQQVVLSIDRLDYTKGIKRRLYAFDKFLEMYPEYIGKVVLVLLVVPSRDKVDQYQQLKEEIDTLVGKIDGKYSTIDWTPIQYFYRSFSFDGLSALYSKADVALITPLRDGMNLVCKEYVASKVTQKGVLILSEMAGAAKELSEAILINPNDEAEIVEALKQALEMPEIEQRNRLLEMQEKLKRYSVHRWVEVFVEELLNVKDRQAKMNIKLLGNKQQKKLKKHYDESKKRIFFLDYDGTLKGFSKDPKAVKPDPELIDLLQDLCADPHNRVIIISGRDRYTLSEWMQDVKLDIIAEHGIWMCKNGGDFHTIEPLSQDWKQKISSIMERYVDRTPGSFLEYKDYSIAWHFRKADPEFGDMRARELIETLHYLTANMNLQTMWGNKVIEVKSRDVNKGKAALKWLNEDKYDFVFTAGDDVTDEDTFTVMPEDAYCVKVGLDATAANYNVKSFKDIRTLLRSLIDG
ncbi:bifunctional alpha,alpha-trehalose-phosphate synthase (UDP-forming)/trehalose-phosphatase [Limibacter armeniacum]|uniref:bifunctional alpha,alpha-trehalose-phosphate synthase (UDP-forming)/trehalose-phosphatase n=1 Tax=Limibacter armeniacum TaxID=466084 RepID=UPI002FE55EB3